MLFIVPLRTLHFTGLSTVRVLKPVGYLGADKSSTRPTSRYILFDGENISFDATLFIYTGLFISPWNILKIRNK